jgi:hypothetical protein
MFGFVNSCGDALFGTNFFDILRQFIPINWFVTKKQRRFFSLCVFSKTSEKSFCRSLLS